MPRSDRIDYTFVVLKEELIWFDWHDLNTVSHVLTEWFCGPEQNFYAPQLYREVLLRRVLAMAILSVRLSVRGVTTRYRTKPRWNRDSESSAYDSLESLVSNEVILMPLGEKIPLERRHQRGVPPPLEIVILPPLAHLAWKRLQIDTDLLLVITTGNLFASCRTTAAESCENSTSANFQKFQNSSTGQISGKLELKSSICQRSYHILNSLQNTDSFRSLKVTL